jgi:hypothetical protein
MLWRSGARHQVRRYEHHVSRVIAGERREAPLCEMGNGCCVRVQEMPQSDARAGVRQGAAEVVQRTVTLYFSASTDASAAAREHVICTDVMRMERQMEAVVFERAGAPEEVLSWHEILALSVTVAAIDSTSTTVH